MHTNRCRIPLALLLALFFAPALFAQMGGTVNPPPSNGSITNGKDKSPVNYENTMNMASTREVNAFKVFEAIPDAQFDKKVKAGQDFIHHFPTGVLLPQVYSTLSVLYIEAGQSDKGFDYGDKALGLNPNDTRTMANLAQALARLNTLSDPESAQKLQKAGQYAQKCIQVTPTLLRPDGVNEDDFAANNNKNLAMAHSALGTINIRRGNYAEAMPDLQEAVRLDGGKDATNFYLLGVASLNSSHYAEAVDAFTKCSATAPANIQKACEDNAAQAKAQLPAAKK